MEGTLWVSWLEYRRRACCDATTEMTFAQIKANSSCVKELGRNRSSRAIWSGVWRCPQRSEPYPTAADARPAGRTARDFGGCEARRSKCSGLRRMRGQLLGTVATAWQCGRYRADCSELLALRAATAGASLAFRAKAVARCETEWWKRSVVPRL